MTMTTVSEDNALASLVVRARTGDRDAMDHLVAQLRPRVYRYVLARMLDPHAAEDVTQEVTMTIVASIDRYVDQGRPFTSWVFGVASNKISESWRGSSRRREDTTAGLPERAAEPAYEPETAVVRLETTERVAAMLATLPPQHAEILRLRIAAGLTAEETAEVLGMSAGAVRVAQHRALAKLRAAAVGEAL
jgi:RNA polymerase sigma-70 factor (ECF subfamily)